MLPYSFGHQNVPYLTLPYLTLPYFSKEKSLSKILILIRKAKTARGMARVDFSQPEIRLVHSKTKQKKKKAKKNYIMNYSLQLRAVGRSSCIMLCTSSHLQQLACVWPPLWQSPNRKSYNTSSHAPDTASITCIMRLKINMRFA